MTEKEKVFRKIDNANNEELGVLFAFYFKYNPFVKFPFDLPSAVRERTITHLKVAIDKGEIKFEPNGGQ